jgi:hypothetical protein
MNGSINDIRYALSLPITPEVIENSQSSIEANLSYSKYLNLCYQVIDTKERLIGMQKHISTNIELVPTNLLKLHLLIESSLYNLLSINFLTPPDSSYINPAYSSYLLRGGTKLMPPKEYLDVLGMGYTRTWGTDYGSLLYAIHMTEEYEGYLSPSQLEDMCSKYFLNSTDLNISRTLSELLDLKYVDEIEVDDLIYKLSVSLIERHPSLITIYNQLNSLSTYITKLIPWYLESLDDSPQAAYLKELSCLFLTNGIDESNSKDIGYMFLHQLLPLTWYDLYPLLLQLRNKAPESNDSLEGNLVRELKEILPPNQNTNILTSISLILTRDLCQPGGLNLYYLLISSALLNRAYILTSPARQELVLSPDVIGSVDRKAKQELTRRVYKLVYLAGYVLKKASMPHIRIVGGNLILLVGQSLPNRSTSKDLLI